MWTPEKSIQKEENGRGSMDQISPEKFILTLERLIQQKVDSALNTKLMLTMDECSELTGIGKTKLTELVRDERIPFVRLKDEDAKHGMIRFPVDELRLWIKKNTTKAS